MTRKSRAIVGLVVGVGVLAVAGVATAAVLSKPPPGPSPLPPGPAPPSPGSPAPLPADVAQLFAEVRSLPTFKVGPSGPSHWMVDKIVQGQVTTVGGRAVDQFFGGLKLGNTEGFS